MLTTEEAQARVARGAAHLDRVRPGWFNRIDVGTLTLSDCYRCVVGQLAGQLGFYRAWLELSPEGSDGESVGWFTWTDAGYLLLQDAWIAAIADRRLATQKLVETPIEAEACVS